MSLGSQEKILVLANRLGLPMKLITTAIRSALFASCAFLCLNAHAESGIIFQKQSAQKDRPFAMVYIVKGDGCAIAWKISLYAEVSKTGISEESHCTIPLERQSPYRDRLLQEVIKDLKPGFPLNSFDFGNTETIEAATFSDRLVAAIVRSKDWDAKRRQPKNRAESIPHFVMRTLNDTHVFRELEDTFARQGYALNVKDVEEVQFKKVNGALLVPYTALVWMDIEKK
jgi:hypothetical protein